MMRFKLIVLSAAAAFVSLGLLAADSPVPSSSSQPSAGKSYQIRNKKFGDLLRPRDANSADGTPIVLYPAQSWKCMTWKFAPAGDAQFHLQNHFTSKTIAASSASGDKPAPVSQVPLGKKADESPTWHFTRLDDGTFKITDAKTGKALTASKDSGDDEVKIVLQKWTGTEEQKWEISEIDPKSLTM